MVLKKGNLFTLVLVIFLRSASAGAELSGPTTLSLPIPQPTQAPSVRTQDTNLNENKIWFIALAFKPQLAAYDQSITESSLTTTRSYLAFSPVGLHLEGRTTFSRKFSLLIRLESTFREQWLSSSDTPATIALRGAAGVQTQLLSPNFLSRPLKLSLGIRPEFNLIPYLVVSTANVLRSGVATSVVLPLTVTAEWEPHQIVNLQWSLGFGIPLFYRGTLGDVIATRFGFHFSTDLEATLRLTENLSLLTGLNFRLEKFFGDQTAMKQGEFTLFRVESDLRLGLAIRF